MQENKKKKSISEFGSKEVEISPSDDARSFGELLKWFRMRENLTQQQVADQLEVKRPRISEWENGQFAPKYRDRVAKLAEIFHLSPVETNKLLQAAIFHVIPPAPTFEPHNPYKGLAAFTQADRHLFFGREALVHDLLSVLQQMMTDPKKSRLLALIGPSGSGKTSIIQAGLLPELQQGAIIGSENWIYLEPIRPSRDPLSSVADVFAHVLDTASVEIHQGLLASPLFLNQLVLSLTPQRKRPIVLVIDQGEELFSSDVEEPIRQAFIDFLVSVCSEPNIPILLLLALRADCYNSVTAYPELARLVGANQQLILPLDRDRDTLRRIIEQPASLPNVKVTFEGNLVDEILFDLHQQVGVLPLLQFTLDQLFQQRENHLLTLQAYQKLGRVNGALAHYTEHLYLNLPSEKHQQLARFLFLRLLQTKTTSEEDWQLSRRQAVLEELLLPDPQETQMLKEVITIFVGGRLLVTSKSSEGPILEVSHEALLGEWPRLGSWMKEAADDIGLQQTLSQVANEWEQLGKPGDRLYRGKQLKAARGWARRNRPNNREQTFLQASLSRHVQFVLSVILVSLVVCSSIGVAGWFFLHQPPSPNLVTTNSDDGVGSLRWAIKNAPSNSTILFASALVGQTITLNTTDIHITQHHLTLQGPVTGAITLRETGVGVIVDKPASTTISGITFQGSNGKGQPSLIQNAGQLTLKSCMLKDNTAFSQSGGIANSGTLFLLNCTISHNTTSTYGGGIHNSNGTVTVSNSVIKGNTAPYESGGGIYNTGTIILNNSAITDNHAGTNGGGIDGLGGTIVLNNSTLSGNTTFGVGGGGIFNAGGTLTVNSSTLSENTAYQDEGSAGGDGGGIFNYGGTITLSNSTLSGNIADDEGNSIVNYSQHSSYGSFVAHAALIFCTIVNNGKRTSSRNKFDIVNNSSSHLYMKASIVGENNTLGTPISGEITSDGYNILQQIASLKFTNNKRQKTDQSINNLTSVFGPSPTLDKHGGSTQTYQLISRRDNPALGIIPQNACTDTSGRRILYDQRGKPRPGPGKDRCDSGAYEVS